MQVDLGSRAWAGTTANLGTRPSLSLEKGGSSHKQLGFKYISFSFPLFQFFFYPCLKNPVFQFLSHFSLPFWYSVSLNKHGHSLRARTQGPWPETQDLTERLSKQAGTGGGFFPALASPSQKSAGFMTQSKRLPEQTGPQAPHLNLPRTLETLPSLNMSKGRGWKDDFFFKL